MKCTEIFHWIDLNFFSQRRHQFIYPLHIVLLRLGRICWCSLTSVLTVYGQGLNVRDWLYVENHCKAIDLIVRKGRIGEIYNVGGHNEMRNIDIVKLIVHELGKSEDLITYVTDRKGHDMRYAIDPTKIRNELGVVAGDQAPGWN